MSKAMLCFTIAMFLGGISLKLFGFPNLSLILMFSGFYALGRMDATWEKS